MTRIDVGTGVSIGYQVDGEEGDWVLLIMGLAYARWGWHWNAAALGERFRVVSFDNRGVGESDAPPGPYTARMMAEDAAGLLDALGIERAHVVGTSLGGFIAQELAFGWPEKVGRLVLACTGFGGPDFVPMPEQTLRLIAEAPSLPDEERLRRFIENAFSPGYVAARPDVVEQVIDFRRATGQPLEAYMSQWNAGATFDFSDRIGQIRAETLVVTGDEDVVVDPRNSPLLAEAIPGARCVRMRGGHLFFVEQAEAFNRLVAEFFAAGEVAADAEEVSRDQEPGPSGARVGIDRHVTDRNRLAAP